MKVASGQEQTRPSKVPRPSPRWRGRSDSYNRSSRGLCARLESSRRRPYEPPAPGGRAFPGPPPLGSPRPPLSRQSQELLAPAAWWSGPRRSPKCRSTSPGTGRCWLTRISRSTCARSVRSPAAGAPPPRSPPSLGPSPLPGRAADRAPGQQRARPLPRLPGWPAGCVWTEECGLLGFTGGRPLTVGSRLGSFH